MSESTYDIVTVGGGLAGSCLAKVMAEKVSTLCSTAQGALSHQE